MTANPSVSVFMPTYRRGDSGLLEAAIESVLGQEFRDFELLVADDGSTDSTARILADFAAKDGRFRHIRHESNSGLPARRIAELLPIASGKYHAYMFDDDLWYPHALSTLIAALEAHPDWDMTYGNVRFPCSAEHGTVVLGGIIGHTPKDFDAERLRASNYIANVGVVHRREILDRVGALDPHVLVRRLCDWDLWLRIARRGSIGHTDVLVGETNGVATTDSLGHTASMDLELTQLYMSLDRDSLLRPQSVLQYPVDGLEVFGKCPPPMLVPRAARQFAAFYRQVGAADRADTWERLAGSGRQVASRVSALVVLCSPAKDVLTTIDSYRDQVDTVIVLDNREEPDGQLAAELESRGVIYVSLGGNTGTAAALNEGCRRARSLGFDWVVTLDQDSTATPGMVSSLFACIELEQPLADEIDFVAPVWRQTGGPPGAAGGCSLDQDGAFVSGSLTRLSAVEELGGFREGLFVEHVDSEYCMRAQRRSLRIVQRQDAVLLRTDRCLRRVTFPIPCWVTDYSPMRRYYMIRNFFQVKREHGREFPAWVVREHRYWRREILKIMLAEPHRIEKAKVMIQGWLDYRRGRLGRYEDLHHR
jgi:glycosyltransferase involved in cell wall biosynthesis